METGIRGRKGAVGYAFRLPGLYAEGETPERVLSSLPEAITAEIEWLAGHGVRAAFAEGPIRVEQAERIDLATDVARGIWRGLFQYELRRTTDEDVETTLERARFAREDVLARIGSSGPDEEIAARLRAHADAEWELLSKLGVRLRADLPDDPVERLSAVRAHAENRLRNLMPGDRERLAVFDGEKWTARKVLRCFVVAEKRLLHDLDVHSPR